MAPTIPPRPNTTRHTRGDSDTPGSTRGAFEHPIEPEMTESKRGSDPMRTRLDSSGSTRGAFYKGQKKKHHTESSDHPQAKRKSKRASKKSTHPPTGMASVVETEPFEENPKQGSRPSLAAERANAIAMGGHRSGSMVSSDIENPQVMDSSVSPDKERVLYDAYASGSSNDPRYSVRDSLRYSDVSLWGANIRESAILDASNLSITETPGWYGPTAGMPPPQTVPSFPPPGMKYQAYSDPSQQQEIDLFSSMVHADYGSNKNQGVPQPPPFGHPFQQPFQVSASDTFGQVELEEDEERSFSDDEPEPSITWRECISNFFDPTDWLMSDATYDEDGMAYFDANRGWTVAALVRHFLYNPEYPEFTSLQQFSWAIILGILMGVYTAFWKAIIESCVLFMWQTIPAALLRWGIFTDLDGGFPLPHYMWICPTICGGLLSYISLALPTPVPGQNDWILTLHSMGVQGHESFWTLFMIATAGMASGLSLGPEAPLVITGGMVGSYLGVLSKQSMLQARVMNLTAAGACVGGFFGFPMAGAIFVLEIPHRMGLQYFEALSPATISSIVAVLVNRMVTGDDVTGYYNYPFLSATLPSKIFTAAIVYGLAGSAIGIGYAESVLYLKTIVNNVFLMRPPKKDASKEKHDDGGSKVPIGDGETIPLVGNPAAKLEVRMGLCEKVGSCTQKLFACQISNAPTRAGVAGCLAGFFVGVTCMFVPHVAFWGEAQLQSLIDKGRTPLPVFFGEGSEYTQDLTAYGYCLIDPNDPSAVAAGFSLGCSALIATAKVFTTGLSVGTGIIGGHFWGPLFVGCVMSHFFTDLANLSQRHLGFGGSLSTYPCVAILCFMGSAHVVTFRAHMAIMLILTLTISAFDPENDTSGEYTAGDYSAVFPLLVVAVFVSLMLTRGTVFYKGQRSRGDIMALPAVLCEPGKAGNPMVLDYDGDEYYDDSDESMTDDEGSGEDESSTSDDEYVSQQDIEKAFDDTNQESRITARSPRTLGGMSPSGRLSRSQSKKSVSPPVPDPSPPAKPEWDVRTRNTEGAFDEQSGRDLSLPSMRLEELLAGPLEPRFRPSNRETHRRIHSSPDLEPVGVPLDPNRTDAVEQKAGHKRTGSSGRERTEGGNSPASTPSQERLVQVTSYGEISGLQPSLMDQARRRAASMHNRTPSLPRLGRHSRKNSDNANAAWPPYSDTSGALTGEDVERSFSSAVNQQGLGTPTASRKQRSIWSTDKAD